MDHWLPKIFGAIELGIVVLSIYLYSALFELIVTEGAAETIAIIFGVSAKADEGSAIAFTVYPFGRVSVIVYPFSNRSPCKFL